MKLVLSQFIVNLFLAREYNSFNFYATFDVVMGAMASKITSPTIVYSSVYSGVDKKNPSSTSLAFVWGIHR